MVHRGWLRRVEGTPEDVAAGYEWIKKETSGAEETRAPGSSEERSQEEPIRETVNAMARSGGR
jgi:hypothetical protein